MEEIEDLIDFYFKTGDEIFVDFASLLSRFRDPIINSFVMVEKHGSGGIYDSRLSNGPIEPLNRKVKNLKRMGRGYCSFEHFRNRFLYSTRNNPPLNSTVDYNSVLYLEDDDQEVWFKTRRRIRQQPYPSLLLNVMTLVFNQKVRH